MKTNNKQTTMNLIKETTESRLAETIISYHRCKLNNHSDLYYFVVETDYFYRKNKPEIKIPVSGTYADMIEYTKEMMENTIKKYFKADSNEYEIQVTLKKK